MRDLSGRVVVITGAGGGIGATLARRLSTRGARLVLTSRSPAKLAAVMDDLGGTSDYIMAYPADLTDESSVTDLFATVGSSYGHVDALVNVAGLSIPGKVADASVEEYRAVMDANVTTAFLCSKHAVPLLAQGDSPAIVNVSSVAGLRPNGVAPLYCTAKAALEMFTRAFALQAREHGIRVTAISPGGTDTGFWGDRPIDRSKLLDADDVVDALEFVLTVGPAVQVTTIEIDPFHP